VQLVGSEPAGRPRAAPAGAGRTAA